MLLRLPKINHNHGASAFSPHHSGSRFDHQCVKIHLPQELLGQFEIFESRRIAERDQDGAATLRRVGTVRSVRLDIPLRARWI